jgi:sigma-B regulation protein RsbU (phosphoserine phosphatase)
MAGERIDKGFDSGPNAAGFGSRRRPSGFWQNRSKLEKAAIIVLAISLAGDALAGDNFPRLTLLLHFAVAGCFLALLFRYVRKLLSLAIWRLRHRLLITYVFIAFVPIALLVAIAGVSIYIFFGMTATYMASSEVHRLEEELAQAGHSVSLDVQQRGLREEDLGGFLTEHLAPNLKGLEPEAHLLGPQDVAPWFTQPKGENGLVRAEQGFEVRTVKHSGKGYLVISAALERTISAWMPGNIGVVTLATESRTARSGAGKQFRLQNKSYRTVPLARPSLPPPASWWDIEITWAFTEPVYDWETGDREEGLLIVHSRPSLLNERLRSHWENAAAGGNPSQDGSDLSQLPFTILKTVGILFLLIEIGSAIVGIHLTRTITGAVDDLYEGTQRVNRGDFSYRIPVRARDQLSGLAESFNTMTVSLERLVRESKESQKLQSELEIASQVQRQLFPKQLPNLHGLELMGICRPARVVSGDYYDFVAFNDTHLALAIGDIAGKGISAALVMAGVQSALHAQLYQGRRRAAFADHGGERVTEGVLETLAPDRLVRQLNRQLYESTSASTFATFCYLTYDDAEGRLTYCNAGHLPPLIVGRDGTRRLTRGGIVLGILPDAQYEAESVILRRGDLLVCYTDGITEPENSYGGEFGEDRLIQVIQKAYGRSPREVAQAILQSVEAWSDSPEAADDMTLLVARRL